MSQISEFQKSTLGANDLYHQQGNLLCNSCGEALSGSGSKGRRQCYYYYRPMKTTVSN